LLSFKSFLNEEKLRQGLDHFNNLSYEKIGKLLSSDTLQGTITPKTDGAAGAVGWDENGFFTQSGRSDKVRNAGDYSAYTRKKRGEDADLTISSSYDAMHHHLQNNKKLTQYLRSRHESGQPSTLKGEFFLRHLAKPTEKGLTFVATSYNPNSMGSTGMFILHHKLPENSTHNPDDIHHLSDKHVTFDHDKSENNKFSVDTQHEKNLYSSINPSILKSRKLSDSAKKEDETEKLATIKSFLETKLKHHTSNLSPRPWEVKDESEGHVFHLDNGERFKIQSDSFKNFKDQEKLRKNK
jgi:hypothetical protein